MNSKEDSEVAATRGSLTREERIGALVMSKAISLGFQKGAEGELEYLMRLTYQTGFNDALGFARDTVLSAEPYAGPYVHDIISQLGDRE
jgi:hypothetical protein